MAQRTLAVLAIPVVPRDTAPPSPGFYENLRYVERRLASAPDDLTHRSLNNYKKLLLSLVDAGSMFVRNTTTQQHWGHRIRLCENKSELMQVMDNLFETYGRS